MSAAKKKTVLVVDDDDNNRFLLEHVVEKFLDGCTAVVAANAEEAIEKVKGGLVFDLLITDLCMGRMSGDELILWLRQAGHRQPAVILTGFVTEPRSLSMADDVIHKPFEMDDFTARLEQLLQKTPAAVESATG